MRYNGERIYAGLMEREDMLELEEENHPPHEADLKWEMGNNELEQLINKLEQDTKGRDV